MVKISGEPLDCPDGYLDDEQYPVPLRLDKESSYTNIKLRCNKCGIILIYNKAPGRYRNSTKMELINE